MPSPSSLLAGAETPSPSSLLTGFGPPRSGDALPIFASRRIRPSPSPLVVVLVLPGAALPATLGAPLHTTSRGCAAPPAFAAGHCGGEERRRSSRRRPLPRAPNSPESPSKSALIGPTWAAACTVALQNTRPTINEGEYMTRDHMDESTPLPLPQSTVTNNESAGPSYQNASATPFPRSTVTNNETPRPSNQNASATPAQPVADDTGNRLPMTLSFAMTINKAQGQTIPNAGVYLHEPVFFYCQLYVALSRATARSNIKILAVPPSDNKDKRKKKIFNGTYTKNIVYREILT